MDWAALILTEFTHGDRRIAHPIGKAPFIVIPAQHAHQLAIDDLRLRQIKSR